MPTTLDNCRGANWSPRWPRLRCPPPPPQRFRKRRRSRRLRKAATLNHASLAVSDVAAAADFYQRLLDLKVVSRPGNGGINLGLGDGFLGVYKLANPGTVNHVCIGVDDYDPERLRRRLNDTGLRRWSIATRRTAPAAATSCISTNPTRAASSSARTGIRADGPRCAATARSSRPRAPVPRRSAAGLSGCDAIFRGSRGSTSRSRVARQKPGGRGTASAGRLSPAQPAPAAARSARARGGGRSRRRVLRGICVPRARVESAAGTTTAIRPRRDRPAHARNRVNPPRPARRGRRGRRRSAP